MTKVFVGLVPAELPRDVVRLERVRGSDRILVAAASA